MPPVDTKVATTQQRVSIRPGVGILSVLRHLNYKAWFAMAEFVDNSLQSYLQNREALQQLHGPQFRLKVEIEVERSDETRVKIRDNAAGIAIGDYARAFRPAELPTDRTGLAEFGMGMKSAACWFAPQWKVRTSALGEPVQRTISLDIDAIVRGAIEEIEAVEAPAAANDHFTEITLIEPYDKLQTKTGGKIKDHLASIYRLFLREGTMELWFNRESLSYEIPKILVAPYYKTPTEAPRQWQREFAFDFGLGLKASGFAALREVASTSTAGFALFRRKRLIEGSLDEPYRPEFIFGTSNSYRKQRLIGEIHLEGFQVSHTKDGFQWEDHEQPFLELLREALESEQLPLLSQAEGHRVRVSPRELKVEAEKANERVAETVQKEAAPILEQQSTSKPFLRAPSRIRAARPVRDRTSHRSGPQGREVEDNHRACDGPGHRRVDHHHRQASVRGPTSRDHRANVPCASIHAAALSHRLIGNRSAGPGRRCVGTCGDHREGRRCPPVRNNQTQSEPTAERRLL